MTPLVTPPVRPVLLLLALLAAPARAQTPDAPLTGSRAEAVADSLFGALFEAERAQFGEAETVALYGDGGALFYRVAGDGAVECRPAFRAGPMGGFGDLLCLTPSEDGGDEGLEDGEAVTVQERSWEGGTVLAVRLDGIRDADGMDAVEVWVAPDPLRLVRFSVSGTFGSDEPTTFHIERGDFRDAGGVFVPHAFRFTIADPAALVASEGLSPDEFLAAAQQAAQAKPTAETTTALALAKAAAAGGPYVLSFTVDRVEVDGPLPPDLFPAD